MNRGNVCQMKYFCFISTGSPRVPGDEDDDDVEEEEEVKRLK